MATADSGFFDVSAANQVATIRVADSASREALRADGRSIHWEFAKLLSEMRTDNSLRVIVITGAEDGQFWVPPLATAQQSDASKRHRSDTGSLWKTFTGITIAHQAMAEMEKPIVARVNGDAVGTGASVLFNCDLSIAVEDVIIADHHMSMGDLDRYGASFGMVPGDGGLALAPLHMHPMKVKEFLMLAKPYTAREFADQGIINYAVPATDLDAVTDDLVARLLTRSSYALAWTKRVANRQTVAHMNMTVDAASGYELVNFLQHELLGEGRKYTLE
jgi:enoyl-CoA hydratase/carnithine racemase